jgi:hypothetical protein
MLTNHQEFAQGLREVASFLESHPEVELPESTLHCYRLYNKEVAATTARALSQGGRCDKVYEDTLVRLKRSFGPITLEYLGTRSNVCEQIRVGTKIVPEQYIAPRPAVEAQVIPEHEEAVYEWRCSPLLGKPSVEIPEETPALTDGGTPILEGEYVDHPF